MDALAWSQIVLMQYESWGNDEKSVVLNGPENEERRGSSDMISYASGGLLVRRVYVTDRWSLEIESIGSSPRSSVSASRSPSAWAASSAAIALLCA